MSKRWLFKPIRTEYWRPSKDYLSAILKGVKGVVKEGDVIVISEKAISTAKGLIVDESKIQPTTSAHFIASFWMRVIWGYFLGYICHLKPKTLLRLRAYPKAEGAKHKQLALSYAGLLQALRHGSEGGIDVSNLPYSYACLPLPDPKGEAEKIGRYLEAKGIRGVSVMIVDTDMTYTIGSLHLSPRRTYIRNIHGFGGFLTYVLCRMVKARATATPLALWGSLLCSEEALRLAEAAHHIRGSGAGRTAWDASDRFSVGLTEISWSMLESIPHYPIVVCRPASSKKRG
ncbi:MAG: coenzyme F420-0:L-glutamate ligase [Nitrososphaerales archaeon]